MSLSLPPYSCELVRCSSILDYKLTYKSRKSTSLWDHNNYLFFEAVVLSNSLAFLVELPTPTTHCLLCPGNVISMQEHLCLHFVFWLTVATLAAHISDCNLCIHQPRMPGMWNPCRKLLVKQKTVKWTALEVNCKNEQQKKDTHNAQTSACCAFL